MKKRYSLVVVVLVFSLFNCQLFAAETAEQAYQNIFDEKMKLENLEKLFAKSFLDQVPANKILEIVAIYTDSLGNFESLDTSTSPYTLNFEKGKAASRIGFDKAGKINTLWFGAPEITKDNLENVLKLFKEMPGKISVCLIRNNKEKLIDINSDTPMAIGSAFKIYLLKALVDSISAGKHSWDEVVKLKSSWKSLPSGILQDWPDNSNVTLQTLANLMISISDNTATDHIFNLIGREKLHEVFPESSKPVFNTAEMFKLKLFYPELGEKFIKSEYPEKLKILSDLENKEITLDGKTIKMIQEWEKPVKINKLEWLISTDNLCKTIYSLRANKAIQINPAHGIVDKKNWHTVGYKGGSEPGVLNYTWVLQTKDRKDFYCLSCTINNSDEPITNANTNFDSVVIRLINLIKNKKIN
ncbi:MAG: serine hydrolase [Candidatus Rifleibacteriota bacterium]